MYNLHKTLMDLCAKKGVSGYRLCKDTGIQPSFLTDLKMGRQKSLSAANAEKIASYFGVSVSYLMGKEEKEKPSEISLEGLTGAKAELFKMVSSLSDEQARKALRLLTIFEEE